MSDSQSIPAKREKPEEEKGKKGQNKAKTPEKKPEKAESEEEKSQSEQDNEEYSEGSEEEFSDDEEFQVSSEEESFDDEESSDESFSEESIKKKRRPRGLTMSATGIGILKHLVLKESFDLHNFLLKLLENLRGRYPADFSKQMLLALEHVFTENIETAQIAQNSEIFQKNWKKVEPEALDILFRTFNFTPDEKEIYEYAAELWESNSWRSSLYLASKFNFSIQFENQFSVIETLVEGYYFNSIPTFISNNNNLLQKCIEVMSKYKCYKEAGKIVEIAGYDINDYPLLIEGQWVSSMTYFLNFDNIGIYQLISIISNTPFLLASAAEKLFQSNKSINSWQSKIAAGIAQQFPTCPIRSEIREMLKSIAPRPISLQCDSFSPLQPEFEIAFPLPRDTIHFIDTPEALANVFFTGQIIGLDCEWRSELFKYKNYKVSIIQIACEDIVYLIDLIALNTNPELDEKLTSLMQSDAYKVGVSFEGDILKLNSSYPHLSAFKNPIKNYIDLVRAHVKRFGNNPRGLAGCCELVLKKSLCKYEQRSNWENRPLTESQTHYAALDAYIQIMILKKLMKSPKFDIKRAFGGQMSRKKMPHSKILGCDLCGSKQHEKNCCKRGKRCKICFMTGHKPINCIR